jgi:hypothetical protein
MAMLHPKPSVTPSMPSSAPPDEQLAIYVFQTLNFGFTRFRASSAGADRLFGEIHIHELRQVDLLRLRMSAILNPIRCFAWARIPANR